MSECVLKFLSSSVGEGVSSRAHAGWSPPVRPGGKSLLEITRTWGSDDCSWRSHRCGRPSRSTT